MTSDFQVRLSLATVLAVGLLLTGVGWAAPQTFETAKLVVAPEFDDVAFQEHLARDSPLPPHRPDREGEREWRPGGSGG
jgi:hypothetical protein